MKQVILVRKDLKLGKGKIGSQVAHASLGAYRRTEKKRKEDWDREGSKKIVLKVEDESKLIKFQEIAREKKLINFSFVISSKNKVWASCFKFSSRIL